VICNTKQPSVQIVDKYKGENSYFVEPVVDSDRLVVREDLLVEYPSGDKILARHDAQKTARIIVSL
jgi:hypothetical protein